MLSMVLGSGSVRLYRQGTLFNPFPALPDVTYVRTQVAIGELPAPNSETRETTPGSEAQHDACTVHAPSTGSDRPGYPACRYLPVTLITSV